MIQTAPVYSTSNKRRSPDDHLWRELRSFRLPQHHQQDVKDVAMGVEETSAGVCTKYLLDSTCGGHSADADDEEYVRLLELERWCDRYGAWTHPVVAKWTDRIRRCRRAFALMHEEGLSRHVAVLHVSYGPIDPLVRTWDKFMMRFGELAGLARYTDAVEERRVEMARLEAVAMATRPITSEEVPPGSSAWQSGIDGERRAMAVRNGFQASHGAAIVDLIRHKECYRTTMMSTTSADALRTMVEAVCVRRDKEPDGSFKDRHDAFESKREVFLTAVKVECDRMLAGAGEKYRDAWLRVTA